MKVGMKVDVAKFEKILRGAKLNVKDMLDIEGAGAAVLTNGMRMRVPVDTAATKTSIGSHIATATDETVVDEVGAETEYAPFIEYGVASKPNYPMQPFVRPTVQDDGNQVINAISSAFSRKVDEKWQK